MRTYGLIGKTLGHSFSSRYFEDKFARENMAGYLYKLFPLEKISDLVPFIHQHPDIKGLNVTIPYKQDVIQLLDELSADAKTIGAVNTIKIIRNGNDLKLQGFNTDATGFLHSCAALQKRLPALVLGTGGSAQAVTFILKRFQIPFISVSRNPKEKNQIGYNDLNQRIIENHKLIINTTPLGMFPDTDSSPPIPYHLLTNNHFLFDLVYNPAETLFLQKGKAAGAIIQNGELMLELQAERSWEIWNS